MGLIGLRIVIFVSLIWMFIGVNCYYLFIFRERSCYSDVAGYSSG